MKHVIRAMSVLSAGLLVMAIVSACTIEIRGDGSSGYMRRHAKVVFVGEVLEITDTPKVELEMEPTATRLGFVLTVTGKA
jgi:hypothetical protein